MSQLDRRQALRLLAALGAAGAAAPVLSACSSGADDNANEGTPVRTGPPVKIGMVVPQTGLYKPFGDDMANGFQLYLRLHGNRLGGRDVELLTADEGETAETGVAAATSLIKDKNVLALTGVATNQVILAIRDLVESGPVPLIASNASPGSLQGTKFIWRTSFVASEPGAALAPWVTDHVSGTLAVVAADYPGDRDEVNAFLEAFNSAGGKLVGPPRFTPTSTKDFGPVFAQVKASGAGGMCCFYTGTAAVDFVKQYKAANFGAGFRVFAPGSLTEGFALKQQGEAARGIFTALNYSPDLDNATNRRFIADYQKAFNVVPSTYAVASYDAANVLDKAIAGTTEELTPLSLNAAVGRLGQIDSPRGGWQFTQNRTPLQKWYLRQVRNDGAALSNVLTAELTTLG